MMILKHDGTPLKVWGEHAISDPLQQLYQSTNEGKKRIASLPVCPTCERVGFRDKGWKDRKSMCCPHCGYNGPSTHVYSAYIDEGLYK